MLCTRRGAHFWGSVVSRWVSLGQFGLWAALTRGRGVLPVLTLPGRRDVSPGAPRAATSGGGVGGRAGEQRGLSVRHASGVWCEPRAQGRPWADS